MIAFIRESNVLVKHFDGKHQKSLVKIPAKSYNFTDRKEYEPLCFLVPQLAKIWPNIRSDPVGFKFKRRQIPERQDSRKFLEIRFNFYEVQWNSVYLSCYGKRKKTKNKKNHEVQGSSSELSNAQRRCANWVLNPLCGPFEAVL